MIEVEITGAAVYSEEAYPTKKEFLDENDVIYLSNKGVILDSDFSSVTIGEVYSTTENQLIINSKETYYKYDIPKKYSVRKITFLELKNLQTLKKALLE